MIDKTERQFFQGSDHESVVRDITQSLYQYGIAVSPVGPYMWGGKSGASNWGMTPKVSLSVTSAQGGFFVDARVSADFDQNGLIIFVVCWLFFFPAAIIVALLGYQDFQNRSQQTLQAIWYPVQNRIAAPPGMQPWGAGQA